MAVKLHSCEELFQNQNQNQNYPQFIFCFLQEAESLRKSLELNIVAECGQTFHIIVSLVTLTVSPVSGNL